MDVGASLRIARERSGQSLERVAQATKIRVAILRAIEANAADQLPAAIYLKAFVRAYAREVGLDPDETAQQYIAQIEPVVDVGPRDPAESSAARSEREPSAIAVNWPERWSAVTQWLAIFIVVAGIAAGYALLRPRTAPEPAAGAQASVPERAVDKPAGAEPTPRTAIGTAGAVDRPRDHGLHLQMRAIRACWVTAAADGKRAVYRLMQPGESDELNAQREIVLRVGDPAAFSFSIDGGEGRPLGRPGQPVTARITPDNYREFLQR